MSFVLTLISLMLIGDVLWWVYAHGMCRSLKYSTRWRAVVGIFMGMQLGVLLALLGGRLAGHRLDLMLPRAVLVAAYLWHFILLPVAVVWMVLGMGMLGANWMRRRVVTQEVNAPEAGLSRRELLQAATAWAPAVGTTIITGASFAQLNSFRIRKFDLVMPGLPEPLNGLKIAQVSDIHVGQFTSGATLRKIVEATNNLRSDLVLLTGDLINFAMSDLSGALDAVNRMDARYGFHMIQGNHDLIQGRDEFDVRVRKAGVPLLVNESNIVHVRNYPVQLLGLRWGPGRGEDGVATSMEQLTGQLVPGAFPILMAHHPHAFDPAAAAGIPLTLAGHTHGGQIMPFGVGFGPLMYRYWSGLYEKGASKLIVSNGVGNWFPLRINAPAEIVEIVLRRV